MYKKVKENAKEVSKVMWLLANENRLMILCYIWKGEKLWGDMSKDLGISQSLVSQILKKFEVEDILESKREGKEVYYEIKDKKIMKLIRTLIEIYC